MFEYNAELIRVIDGDTIDVEIDFGFSLKQTMRLRLADIDAEELRSPNPEQRILALAAKRYLQEMLEDRPLIVQTIKTKSGKERETFGRYVARVYFEEWVEQGVVSRIYVNNELVSNGFAKQWEG